MKVTLKQEIFCKEYIVDFNATRAAIAAGYSKKTARAIGYEILTKPYIQEAIKREIDQRSKRVEITQDRVLQEIAVCALADLADYIEVCGDGAVRVKAFDELPEGASRALESISEDRIIKETADGSQILVHDKRKIKMHSKLEALDKLGRHLGVFAADKKSTLDVTTGGKPLAALSDLETAARLAYLIKAAAKRKEEDMARGKKSDSPQSSKAKKQAKPKKSTKPTKKRGKCN